MDQELLLGAKNGFVFRGFREWPNFAGIHRETAIPCRKCAAILPVGRCAGAAKRFGTMLAESMSATPMRS